MNLHAAVAASLVSVIACSCGSAAPFLEGNLTNIRVAIVLETATTLGALTGVLLAGVLAVPFLLFLFAAILLVSAWQMMARRRESVAATEDANLRDWATALRLHSSYLDQLLRLIMCNQ
ncbi:MAG: anion permease [Gammaproteobacteria bacterium]|nr:anion permease [Gammaproteobacteria bacterium]